MQRGDVVAERFEIEALVASGGMGQIFRAQDRQSGEVVAVKVLRSGAREHHARFQHETRALSELAHPRIVRYVAHGVVATSGEPYLAMEWLEGEDLSRRLARAELSLEESIGLGKQIAEALGEAHARGIVHRDLKPSNVFLVGGSVDQIKVVDFGIARLDGAARLTRTGTIMGTPGYMAPEQVQNARVIDARADVFSLGCVLFECVTGIPAFTGEHLMALLAKVFIAEPPRLCELRPDAPAALEQLLLRMMAKNPEARPRNGAAVLENLAALTKELPRGTTRRASIALTSGERRTMTVIVIEAERREDVTLEGHAAQTAQMLREGTETFGGRLDVLRDGSAVASMGAMGLATDQAAQAARCALWLHANTNGRAVALATGRGELTGRMAAAEAIDRAVKLLESRPAAVAIDEMTARLLDGRFDVRETEAGATLHGEREIAEEARLLLKKATPCVGRDRELSTLSQMFAESIEERTAQAALVVAAAGMGKSRLSQELLARLRANDTPMAVWIARGDVLRVGSALGLLGQALRHACGIRGDEPLPERREKLLGRVAERVGAQHRQRVAELLGEIAGVPFPEDSSELLRAARRNTQIMTDEMRRAWLDFLRAECAVQPVLLVLEDLHWGDLPTVQFVDAALRDVSEEPWMVLAIARPEVHSLFPELWEGRHLQEIQLKPLGKKASERLVRQVLGEDIGAETLERLIAQADGNAFYLEELIRAAAERKGEGFPETVVAMVQSRLAALDDEDRRALRAAAVFGEAFWPGGVAALLDRADRPAQVRNRLLHLVEREVLVKRPESRFAGQVELAFRHVLLREGAYAMLTEEDRRLGHKLAGEWLERAGERDPRLLAEHFDRGEQGERAAAYYLRAAEQALEGGDYAVAIKLSERGVALGQEPGLMAGMRAVEADAKFQLGDFRAASDAAGVTLKHARPGSRTASRALYAGIACAMYLRDEEALHERVQSLQHMEFEPDAIPLLAATLVSLIVSHIYAAERRQAELNLRRLEQMTANRDPIASAWAELARALCACHIDRNPWGFLQHATSAISLRKQSGIGRELPYTRWSVAAAHWMLGQFDLADDLYIILYAESPEGSMDAFATQSHRSVMRIDQRKLDEAAALAAWMLRAANEMILRRISRLVLAEAQLYGGALDAAESELLSVAEIDTAEPYLRLWYLAVMARLRLAQGRAEDARDIAELAFSQSIACGMGYCNRHALLLLVRAEAHHALGNLDAARDAIREARDDLLRRAAFIPDSEPEVRRSFLENIPDHRRTLELAREWLGDDSS
ncbi:MAG: protein kinase [Polyangiaceae bacterium]|nr:protein kinase [Polyangiaceae bacterium]